MRHGKSGPLLAAALFLVSPALLEARQLPADLILYNGKVLTVDAHDSVRSVVIVRNGRILAVGDSGLRERIAARRAAQAADIAADAANEVL